ncbi:MAG: hypothetical protein ACYC66_10755, partial [Chloroflexota bacterium]
MTVAYRDYLGADRLGYVNGVLKRASQATSQLNDGLRLALPEAQVGIDELPAQRKGNLVAV